VVTEIPKLAPMDNWSIAASLATAAGTLVLAAATFVAVRSSNRAARATERALLAGIRPVLVPSRLEDPPEKVGFQDDHFVRVPGGRAVAEVTEDAVYLAMALKNVGLGLAVLDRWDLTPERRLDPDQHHRDPEDFRRLTRDIFVPAGDLGFWQGALRDKKDPLFAAAAEAIAEPRAIQVDLLYRDNEGGQRMITRFTLIPAHDGQWITAAGRHWNLDRSDPR
jgi:hypothetical protein